MNPTDEPIDPLTPEPENGSEIDSSQQEVSARKPKAKHQGKNQTALDALVDKYAEPNEGDVETDTDPAVYDDIEPTSSQGFSVSLILKSLLLKIFQV